MPVPTHALIHCLQIQQHGEWSRHCAFQEAQHRVPFLGRHPKRRDVIPGRLADEAPFTLQAPIAPGLIEPIGIVEVSTLALDAPVRLAISAGSIALDGEREIVFSEEDEVTVTLRAAAFKTIDVTACMAHAASKGCFVTTGEQLQLIEQIQGG